MILRNEADKIVIDIIGKEIGEGWFDESFSANDLNEKLGDANLIEVNLNSLGGDVNDALVMHDLLKSHKARVVVNMLGMNASAATIVAMGGDEVNISENGAFLIHNVWTMTAGNADELEQEAEELRKFDNILAQIYAKKTGKRRDTILNLMKEEKWLDADEAKDWGFVDNILRMNYKNSFKKDDIMKLGKFDLKQNIFDKLKTEYMKDTKLNKLLDVEQFELQDGGVFLNKEQIDLLNNRVEELENKTAELEETHKNALDKMQAKVTELENAKSDLETKLAEKQAELDKMNMHPSEPSVDKDPIDEPKVNKEIEKFLNENPDLKLKLKTK